MIGLVIPAAAIVARLAQASQVVIKVAANPAVRKIGTVLVMGVVAEIAVDTYTGRDMWRQQYLDMMGRREAKQQAKTIARMEQDLVQHQQNLIEVAKEKGLPDPVFPKEVKPPKKALFKRAWDSFKKGVKKVGRFLFGTAKYLTFAVIRTVLAIPYIIGVVVAWVLDIAVFIISSIVAFITAFFSVENAFSVIRLNSRVVYWINTIGYRYTNRLMEWFSAGYFDILRPRAEWKANPIHNPNDVARMFARPFGKKFSKFVDDDIAKEVVTIDDTLADLNGQTSKPEDLLDAVKQATEDQAKQPRKKTVPTDTTRGRMINVRIPDAELPAEEQVVPDSFRRKAEHTANTQAGKAKAELDRKAEQARKAKLAREARQTKPSTGARLTSIEDSVLV